MPGERVGWEIGPGHRAAFQKENYERPAGKIAVRGPVVSDDYGHTRGKITVSVPR